jgi:hypothetical protein
VVYSSKYCCRCSVWIFDWFCCGIYHPTPLSLLQVHCYPYRNRYRFSLSRFFSFLIVISIQHQDMPLFSMQEILEIYLWFLLQHYAGIRLIRLATLINATKMEMHISHLVNGYVLFYLFLSHPCSCFSQNN